MIYESWVMSLITSNLCIHGIMVLDWIRLRHFFSIDDMICVCLDVHTWRLDWIGADRSIMVQYGEVCAGALGPLGFGVVLIFNLDSDSRL